MGRQTVLAAAALIVGIVLVALAVVYFTVAAGSLPSFLPGYAAGSRHIHLKHGVAALLLGLACLVFAWFRSGPKRSPGAA